MRDNRSLVSRYSYGAVASYSTWLGECHDECDSNDGSKPHGDNTACPLLGAYHDRSRLIHGPLVDHEAALIG